VDPAEFAAKWAGSTRSERAASQEHFIDLCRMLDVPTPNEDATGENYAFEKGAEKTSGGDGYADVWKRGHFGWEYKGKRKDLAGAYAQLLLYREALDNPPLLVVCDLDRFQVHTNFTDTKKVVHEFTLADLASGPEEPLRILRAVMLSPEDLKPGETREELTEEAARHFASIAGSLRNKGHDPDKVAHFLTKLLFCLFAEDSGLLPRGLLERLASATIRNSNAFTGSLSELFGKMSEAGGLYGTEHIQWFNGGLFDGPEVVPLDTQEIAVLGIVAALDWSQIEPAIFGTLFERGLDPSKRSQLGAHYTDRLSIKRLVDAVLVNPLRRDFEATKERVQRLLDAQATRARKLVDAGKTPVPALAGRAKKKRGPNDPIRVWEDFLERLRSVTVLDPACGSGNFLYISLQSLKDLEREVILWGSETLGVTMQVPHVSPTAVKGLELNHYAAELARVTIWIGEIQWMLQNGFAYLRDPILRPLDAIRSIDAILDLSDSGEPTEPDWPDATVIVGNPPFLGGKFLRRELGDEYVDQIFKVYEGRVPKEADLVTYWFEKACAMVEDGRVQRAGLLATQAIRGGANRRVLERIKGSGDIFMAWSDEPWILDGAAVHISFVAFDDGSEQAHMLNGEPVAAINADLTSGLDLTHAPRLAENAGIAFMGDTKGGPFDITDSVAQKLLASPNPDGRSNTDVVRPWVNASDIGGRPRGMWIIDFPPETNEAEAALYEGPFEYVLKHVKPQRDTSRTTIDEWWMHERPRVEMRAALEGVNRQIVTPRVAKYRIFVWMPVETLADSATIAIARDDDFTFGVLQSRPHEVWARRKGTQLRERESGFRYTPTTTFETFPFPRPTDEQRTAIKKTARNLVQLRDGWLKARPDRTMTMLYNEEPTWLTHASDALDQAVAEAYGWPTNLTEDELLSRLLALNEERSKEGTIQ
jgi:type II restriction/modification system DNA methylase subunit YeeA